MADQPSPKRRKTAEQANIPFGEGVSDLLKLMDGISHGDKEVFLRDLVFTAAKALKKMRRETLYKSYLIGPRELFIDIIPDMSNHTLSIVDNGIGMKQDDLKKLFTFVEPSALSRYKKHARHLKNNQVALDELYEVASNFRLPSDFYLGFFAAFMVADHVEITTKHYGGVDNPDNPPCRLFASARDRSVLIVGGDQLSLDTPRGTKITLHLNKDQFEYLDVGRLKVLIDKYTFDLVPYPISICSPYGEIIERRLADVEEKKKDMGELKSEFEDLRKLFVKVLYNAENVHFKYAVISDRMFDIHTVVSLDMATIEINPRHWLIKKLRQDHMKNPEDEGLLRTIIGLYVCGRGRISSFNYRHKTNHQCPLYSDLSVTTSTKRIQ